MARRKNKNTQKKRQTAQPQRQRAAPRRRRVRASLSFGGPLTRELAGSMTNPFLMSACLPDGSRGTGCFSLRQTGTLTTGTGGTCYGIFAGLYPDQFLHADTASTVAVTTITGNWSAAASVSTLASIYQAYRIVSAGIKISYVGNTVDDQGVIVVGQTPSDNNANAYNTFALSSLCNTMNNYQTYPLRNGAIVIWRPEAETTLSEWVGVDTTPNALTSNVPHPMIMAYVFNAKTNGASAVQYEIIVNYEGQFKLQTFLAGGISAVNETKNQAEPGWYENAMRMVSDAPALLPGIAQTGLNMLGYGTGIASNALLGGVGSEMMRQMRRQRGRIRNDL